MDENVQMSARAGAWIVQEPRAAGLESLDCCREIGDFDRDVMQSFASFLDELRDHRVGSGGFQQFDARSTGGEHRDFDFFQLDRFTQPDLKAELLLVKGERVVERADRDAQMVNVKFL